MKGRGSLPGAEISAHPEEALPDIRTALVLCQEAWPSVDRPRTHENTGLCRLGAGRPDVGEPASGLEPLTPAHYECAARHLGATGGLASCMVALYPLTQTRKPH